MTQEIEKLIDRLTHFHGAGVLTQVERDLIREAADTLSAQQGRVRKLEGALEKMATWLGEDAEKRRDFPEHQQAEARLRALNRYSTEFLGNVIRSEWPEIKAAIEQREGWISVKERLRLFCNGNSASYVSATSVTGSK